MACPYVNMPETANSRLVKRGNKKTPLAWIDDGCSEKKAVLGQNPEISKLTLHIPVIYALDMTARSVNLRMRQFVCRMW
jgi:hypothetical protein